MKLINQLQTKNKRFNMNLRGTRDGRLKMREGSITMCLLSLKCFNSWHKRICLKDCLRKLLKRKRKDRKKRKQRQKKVQNNNDCINFYFY
jgi:hypothetical protein